MTDTPSLELFLDPDALAATPPAEQQAERVYIVLNTLFNPHFNFNGAWVTHDRFLDSQLRGWTTDVPRNPVQSTEEEEEEEREKNNFI
jgi:hypothetical protein